MDNRYKNCKTIFKWKSIKIPRVYIYKFASKNWNNFFYRDDILLVSQITNPMKW